jgi:hypothetical protein
MAFIVSTTDLARVYAAAWASAGNPLNRIDCSNAANAAVDGFLNKLTELNHGQRPHIGDAVSAWDWSASEPGDVKRSGGLERIPFAPRAMTEHSG